MEIDDKFLEEVGLGGLEGERRKEFIRRTREELELRVGEEVSKGLSMEQIKEFEALSEGDQRIIKKLVLEMDSDFREDRVYQAILKRSGKENGDWSTLGEYLSVRWIQKNCPDYRAIVERVVNELKEKIKSRGA